MLGRGVGRSEGGEAARWVGVGGGRGGRCGGREGARGCVSAREHPLPSTLPLPPSSSLPCPSSPTEPKSPWRASGRPRCVCTVCRLPFESSPGLTRRRRPQIEQVGLERDGRRRDGTLYLTPFHLVFQSAGEDDYQVRCRSRSPFGSRPAVSSLTSSSGGTLRSGTIRPARLPPDQPRHPPAPDVRRRRPARAPHADV